MLFHAKYQLKDHFDSVQFKYLENKTKNYYCYYSHYYYYYCHNNNNSADNSDLQMLFHAKYQL